MALNVKVERNNNENNLSVLRRFTKRVQGSGILRRVRGERYFSRTPSPQVRKKQTLIALEYKKKTDELIKLGKITPNPKRR